MKIEHGIGETEHERLKERAEGIPPWQRWGPYVSERSWATVREDYSPNGDAWSHFPHDQARSRAYRWGEDGLAGICDRYQLLVFAVALWNERDPILKERAFGLTSYEGNHGEDVKEYYFYLDSTPTHSYMKYLYKYPQSEFPYHKLIAGNRRRGPEYELLDTGVFDEDRYFDVFVEYAKASPDDICIKIEAINRGSEAAPLHIIPHLWFRNTWAWGDRRGPEPIIQPIPEEAGHVGIAADDSNAEVLRTVPFDYKLGLRYLYGEAGAEVLFTDNETNPFRAPVIGCLYTRPYYKDAFHRYIIDREPSINPERTGTKACLHYSGSVPAGGSFKVRLRLTPDRFNLKRVSGKKNAVFRSPIDDVDRVIDRKRAEADEFYKSIHPPAATHDERLVQRQALAGLLWSKQIYLFDVDLWLNGDDPTRPPDESRKHIRNFRWQHLNSMRVLMMPDKWEFPWFAAWDLAFQAVAMALVDAGFAKEQLWLLLFEQLQHPNGQIPAYEWEFSDLNPPVHAWACWRVYNMDRIRSGQADREWLEKCFHKLLINFAWWVNKVDSEGNNIFEGGFLGLDNITVIDRSARHPDGVVLEQSDATGWMGMFCLNLMRIALELAKENEVYEGLAVKFFEHYIYVGAAMKHMGGRSYSLWDEPDGFFYDMLRMPDGNFHKFRVRSLVGLIPLYAVERLELDWIQPFEYFRSNLDWFVKNRRDLVKQCCHRVTNNGTDTYALTIADEGQIKRVLERVIDPEEFLSKYGLRSLSKYHEQYPYVFGENEVRYEPAETESKVMGGNSNWRGPIWFPTSFLMIESLRKLGKAYGPNLRVPSPSHGRDVTLTEMAEDLANRLISVFVKDEEGNRPIYGNCQKFQRDPHWRDLILFNEYFHGDSGIGLGASHQTGWTALVASLIDEWRR
jgi:hypothetical protein